MFAALGAAPMLNRPAEEPGGVGVWVPGAGAGLAGAENWNGVGAPGVGAAGAPVPGAGEKENGFCACG